MVGVGLKRIFIFLFFGISVFGLTLPELPKLPPTPAAIKTFSTQGDDTWTTNGPWGGMIQCLDLAPDGVLYAGTMLNGVYKRSSGKDWVPANTTLEYTTIRSLKAKANGTVFAGTEFGLYVSNNRGDSWNRHPQIPEDTVNTIFFADPGGDTIYIGLEHTGFFRSADGGQNWGKPSTLFDQVAVTAFARGRDQVVNRDVLYLGTRTQGVFSSFTGGLSWKPLPSAPGKNIRDLLVVRVDILNYLYVASGDRGCFFSTDGGIVWSTIRLDIPTSDLVARGTKIYAATEGAGVYTVNVGATNWQPVGKLSYQTVSALTLNQADLFAGTTGGVFRNNESNWEDYNYKLSCNFIVDLAFSPVNKGLLYAASIGGGLYRTTDNAQTWQAVTLPGNLWNLPMFYSLALNPTNSDEIYLGSVGAILKSSDGGVTWQSTKLPPPDSSAVLALSVDPQIPTTLFAGTTQSLYKSTNQGNSWSKVWEDKPPVYDIAINPETTSTVYIGTVEGVYKSTDGGTSFFPSSTGIPIGTGIWDLGLNPAFPNILYACFFINQLGLARSVNGAQSWELLPINKYIFTVATDKNLTLAGAYAEGAFFSLDSGKTWQELNSGLKNYLTYSSDIDLGLNHSFYLGTLGGLYTYTDSVPPEVILDTDLDTLSPDGDGKSDSIEFHLNAQASDIINWQFSIDNGNDTVLILSGDGIPPSAVFWNGYNETGDQVKNGSYTARIRTGDMLGSTGSDSLDFVCIAKPMVSGNDDATYPSTSRKLVKDKNDTLHCVYASGNPSEIFYTRSGDNGSTWADPTNVSNSTQTPSRQPTLALDNLGTIAVAWQEGKDIYWRRFRQNQWEAKTRVTNTADTSRSPAIVSDASNNTHLVWTAYTTITNSNDVFYKMFSYNNQFWTDSTDIAMTGGDSKTPTLTATPDGKVHIFWSDNSTANYQIRYREKSATQDTTLTPTLGSSLYPNVVGAGNNNLYLVWCDSTLTPEVLYKNYTAGSGWTVTDTVSESPDTASSLPSIGIDVNNNLYVVWQEGETAGEVYFRNYIGQWQPVQNLSQSAQISRYPSIASSVSDQAGIIWTEGDTKPFTILFRAVSGALDTTKPNFTITAPDSVVLSDSFFIIIAPSEQLDTVQAWLFDTNNDSTVILLNPDGSGYSGNVKAGNAPGLGRITVWGKDLAGNEGSQEKAITITTTSIPEFLDKNTVFAYPSPAKGDTVKFHYVLGEPATVKFDIFTITGRRVYSRPEEAFDTGIHDITILTGKLGSDVYIFRLEARATNSDKHGQVIKKFAVIH